MADEYPISKSLLFRSLAKHVALLVMSAIGVYLKKYTPRNKLENLKLNSKFIITCNLCPMVNLCILNSNLINLWSSYRLDTQRLNDLLYVSYNIRLWVKQIEKKSEVEDFHWMPLTPLLPVEWRLRNLLWRQPLIG